MVHGQWGVGPERLESASGFPVRGCGVSHDVGPSQDIPSGDVTRALRRRRARGLVEHRGMPFRHTGALGESKRAIRLRVAPPGLDRAASEAQQATKTGGGTRKPRAKPRPSLPLLGSNQDSPDPESGVLPVTPRGSGAEGARTPDLLGAIQALSQLSYSPGIGRQRGGPTAHSTAPPPQ